MKRIFLIILTSLSALGPANAGISGEWPTTVSVGIAGAIDDRIDRMLRKLIRQNDQVADKELLQSIFKKTQKEFLHRYKAYANLDELVSGEFDCLTATSLFAVVLTRAGYSFRIIETNYHIFLLVNTTDGEVLLETTDRFSGFIQSEEEIEMKMNDYKAQSPQVASGQTAYLFNFQVFGEIDAAELTGLLYFNQAVKAYNDGAWLSCSEKIMMAEKHYPSPRVKALASVLLYTVSVSEMPESEKSLILSNLEGFYRSAFATASR